MGWCCNEHEVKTPRRMQANQQEYMGKFHRTEHVEITTPDILLATCAYVGCIPVPEASPRSSPGQSSSDPYSAEPPKCEPEN